MNQYEIMYVIDSALEDSARIELINRFSDLVKKNGGEVDRIDEWGKRRLAYAIQYKTEGYYVLMYIKAPADLPREIERNMKISDSVLRYLTVRYEGELPAKREPLKPYVPREGSVPTEGNVPAEGSVPTEGNVPTEGSEAPASAEAAAPVAPAETSEAAPAEEIVDDEKPESEAE